MKASQVAALVRPHLRFGWREWTPSLNQPFGTGVSCTGVGRYCRVGDVVHLWARITVDPDGAGTNGQTIAVVGLPVAPAAVASGELLPTGQHRCYDASAQAYYNGVAYQSGSVLLMATAGGWVTFGLAEGDVIRVCATYQVD